VGPLNVREHFENMMDHNSAEQLSSRRIGFALALPFRGHLEPKNITKAIKAEIEEQKPLRFGISFARLAGFAWGLRNKRDDETFAYGWIPFFLLTTASYYYYVVRVVLIAFHAGENRPPPQPGRARDPPGARRDDELQRGALRRPPRVPGGLSRLGLLPLRPRDARVARRRPRRDRKARR
jgi:hypothetical protein